MGGQGFGGQGQMGGQGFGSHQQPGMGMNRWGQGNNNHHQMNGYTQVDYSQGWNSNVHDGMLQQNVNKVFQKYDRNNSGQLEGQ